MHRLSARPSTNSSRQNTNARSRLRPGEQLASALDSDTRYQFALIPFDELVNDLNGLLSRPVTHEMLRSPTPELVEETLSFFICELLIKKTAELTQPAFGVTDVLRFPEGFKDSVLSQHMLYFGAQRILFRCGYPDFALRDFASPTKPRFHRQISAILNFYRFRAPVADEFDSLASRNDATSVRSAALREERARLEGAVGTARATREAERPALEEIQTQMKAATVKLGGHKTQHTEVTARKDELKEAMAKMDEERERLANSTRFTASQVEEMQSKVVASPARVRAELSEQREQAKSEREYIDGVTRRTASFMKREQAIDVGAGGPLKKASVVAKEANEKVHALDHAVAIITRLRSKANDLRTANQTVEDEKERIKRQTGASESSIARIDEARAKMGAGNTEEDETRNESRKESEAAKKQRAREKAEQNARAAQLQGGIMEALKADLEKKKKSTEDQERLGKKMHDFQRDATKCIGILADSTVKHKDDFEDVVQSW